MLDDMIVAIPDSEENDILEAYIRKLNVDIYRGNEEDVLHRLYCAAVIKKASHVVRICADNPLICGDEIDNLISFYNQNPCDYAYNHIPLNNTYPDGLGAEIVSFDLLKHLQQVATVKKHREHCLSYIWDNRNNFVIKTFEKGPVNWDPVEGGPRLEWCDMEITHTINFGDISFVINAFEGKPYPAVLDICTGPGGRALIGHEPCDCATACPL